MVSKRLGAKGGWRDDSGAANVAALQQSGAVVASHQVIGLADPCHCQQESIIQIADLDAIRYPE
jgi:hypothetical protein